MFVKDSCDTSFQTLSFIFTLPLPLLVLIFLQTPLIFGGGCCFLPLFFFRALLNCLHNGGHIASGRFMQLAYYISNLLGARSGMKNYTFIGWTACKDRMFCKYCLSIIATNPFSGRTRTSSRKRESAGKRWGGGKKNAKRENKCLSSIKKPEEVKCVHSFPKCGALYTNITREWYAKIKN